MARNNIFLSYDELKGPDGKPNGRYKIRWREPVLVDGKRISQPRARNANSQAIRDDLIAKIRRKLEFGEVYEPDARVVVTAANLELAALAWLRWQASRDRKKATRTKYKSAIVKIMATIRAVRGIPADAAIPVSVLDIELFASMRNTWSAEDDIATAAKTRTRAASPMRRYHLSGFLYAIWSFAVSQPAAYAVSPRSSIGSW